MATSMSLSSFTPLSASPPTGAANDIADQRRQRLKELNDRASGLEARLHRLSQTFNVRPEFSSQPVAEIVSPPLLQQQQQHQQQENDSHSSSAPSPPPSPSPSNSSCTSSAPSNVSRVQRAPLSPPSSPKWVNPNALIAPASAAPRKVGTSSTSGVGSGKSLVARKKPSIEALGAARKVKAAVDTLNSGKKSGE